MSELMRGCIIGDHKLEARYDVRKIDKLFQRTYVCDRCVVCGTAFPRPFTIRDQLEVGLISIEELRGLTADQIRDLKGRL